MSVMSRMRSAIPRPITALRPGSGATLAPTPECAARLGPCLRPDSSDPVGSNSLDGPQLHDGLGQCDEAGEKRHLTDDCIPGANRDRAEQPRRMKRSLTALTLVQTGTVLTFAAARPFCVTGGGFRGRGRARAGSWANRMGWLKGIVTKVAAPAARRRNHLGHTVQAPSSWASRTLYLSLSQPSGHGIRTIGATTRLFMSSRNRAGASTEYAYGICSSEQEGREGSNRGGVAHIC